MEESRISRRKGLAILGAAAGSALLGASLAGVANAAPSVRRDPQGALSPNGVSPADTTYILTVVNNSTDFVDMCVYQNDPDIGVPNILSLAWFAKPAEPTTTVVFKWTIAYSFVWSETGTLIPGVEFAASQSWPADPSAIGVSDPKTAGNQIGLTYDQVGQAYTFDSVPTKGAQRGTLYINEDATIPLNQASVGIGMSGSGTYAVQAQPNETLTFSPHPVYYLAAGTFKQGIALDTGSINNPVQIQFPVGVFAMTAVLQQDNTWSVFPTK
jgi:hypothetical protein